MRYYIMKRYYNALTELNQEKFISRRAKILLTLCIVIWIACLIIILVTPYADFCKALTIIASIIYLLMLVLFVLTVKREEKKNIDILERNYRRNLECLKEVLSQYGIKDIEKMRSLQKMYEDYVNISGNKTFSRLKVIIPLLSFLISISPYINDTYIKLLFGMEGVMAFTAIIIGAAVLSAVFLLINIDENKPRYENMRNLIEDLIFMDGMKNEIY